MVMLNFDCLHASRISVPLWHGLRVAHSRYQFFSFPTQFCIVLFRSMTIMPVLFLYVCLEVCLAQLLARWGRDGNERLTTTVTFRFPRASSERHDARNIVLQSGAIPAGQPCISSLSMKCTAMVTRRHPSGGMRSSFRNKR